MRSLTGIKPTNVPHLGNLLGAIRPAIQLQATHEALYFIADLHALTTLQDAPRMRRFSLEVAATWLANGLDPTRTVLWAQSDVAEVTELAWILSCVIGFGALERAHAFKSARDAGRDINVGTFSYPVLMAADILAFDSNVVPVGKDQKQHVEMARDMALAFNARFGEALVVPEPLIQDNVATVPGIDGRKMSKSYDNGIEIFLPAKALRKRVMQIVTDATPLEDPKNPDSDNVFALYRLFASPEQAAALAARYRGGNYGYGHAKQELFELLDAELAPRRAHYEELLANPSRLEAVLEDGASRARAVARTTLSRVREACGFRASPRGV